jgi:hypothetical protein
MIPHYLFRNSYIVGGWVSQFKSSPERNMCTLIDQEGLRRNILSSGAVQILTVWFQGRSTHECGESTFVY